MDFFSSITSQGLYQSDMLKVTQEVYFTFNMVGTKHDLWEGYNLMMPNCLFNTTLK